MRGKKAFLLSSVQQSSGNDFSINEVEGKFKNLSIGYTLPINKRFFEKVRVYVSGENLYYWSPLKKHNKTIDPELAISSSTYSSNTGSGYAYPRVYTVGVDITF